ncbi:Stathmin Domain-Containing Protein 1 [Manis pentadactyla]|nr:Stathmin Domain-Containing Protein 1 [Manis pentadactyla]
MGCTPSRPADDERRVSAPGKGVQADVGAADSRGTCSPQMEAVLPRDTVSSPEGLEKQAQLGSLPGTVLESSTPLSERNGRVNSVLGSGGPIRKPQALENGERPKSSDILEELIVQGIIQSHSKGSRNGESDDIMANTAKAPLRKPPARLEKLKIDKEAKAFPVKVRAEGQRAVEPGRKAPQLLQESRLRALAVFRFNFVPDSWMYPLMKRKAPAYRKLDSRMPSEKGELWAK